MGTTAYGGKGQGKGKGRGEGRLGQGGRGRSKGGERPMGTTAYGGKGSKGRAANGDRPVGAASCRREQHTMASCQPPPPPDQQLVGGPNLKGLPPSAFTFGPLRYAVSWPPKKLSEWLHVNIYIFVLRTFIVVGNFAFQVGAKFVAFFGC